MSDTYYDPWRHTAQNIGNVLLQTPELKQRMIESRMRGTLYQQQIARQTAEREAMEQKGRMITSIEQNAPQAMIDVQNGTLDTPAVRSVIGATSGLSGERPETVAEAFGRMIGMAQAGKVNDPTAMFSSTFGKPPDETQAVNEAQWRELQRGRDRRNRQDNRARVRVARENNRYQQQNFNQQTIDTQTGQPIGNFIFNTPAGNNVGTMQGGQANVAVPAAPRITTAPPGSYVYSGTNQIAQVPNAKLNEIPYELKEIIKTIQNDDDDAESKAYRIRKAIENYNNGLAGGVRSPQQGYKASTNSVMGGKPLDLETARGILKEAGGDKDKARWLARERGFAF